MTDEQLDALRALEAQLEIADEHKRDAVAACTELAQLVVEVLRKPNRRNGPRITKASKRLTEALGALTVAHLGFRNRLAEMVRLEVNERTVDLELLKLDEELGE